MRFHNVKQLLLLDLARIPKDSGQFSLGFIQSKKRTFDYQLSKKKNIVLLVFTLQVHWETYAIALLNLTLTIFNLVRNRPTSSTTDSPKLSLVCPEMTNL